MLNRENLNLCCTGECDMHGWCDQWLTCVDGWVPQAADKVSQCYQALERKAALYEKLARGQMVDEAEMYDVDFVRKGFLSDEPEPHTSSSSGGFFPQEASYGTGGLVSADMQMERERASWEQEVTAAHDNELLSEEQRRERKTAIDEINRETKDGRERTQTLKERRQAQAERNRERLRTAFLKKQVAKLKSQETKYTNPTEDSKSRPLT
mmetsp:Transcript_40716/g.77737  ORF Transcript_40716/g.77737 Transcript_40716/m.77737 type:complete len:209 (-) Transcript_40716:325-951(-)